MFKVIMGRRKAIILTSITILFLCSMGCQSATFEKGICCYVGVSYYRKSVHHFNLKK